MVAAKHIVIFEQCSPLSQKESKHRPPLFEGLKEILISSLEMLLYFRIAAFIVSMYDTNYF